MPAEPKKGQGGGDEPPKKKPVKKAAGSRPPMITVTEPAGEETVVESTGQLVIQPSAPSLVPAGTHGKGKAPVREAAEPREPEIPYRFPPPVVPKEKWIVLPVPPFSGFPAPTKSKSKTKYGTAEYRTHPVKGPSGSLSNRSEKSLNEVSLGTTAYSQPLMEYMVTDEKIRTENRQLVTIIKGGSFVKTKLTVDKKVQIGQKYTALMLYPGQGGTFGYGNVYQDEKGAMVRMSSVKDREEDAENSMRKVRHLLWYGNGKNVEMIGTSGCISCVGVYFELSNNRVFCAHINALHFPREVEEIEPPMERDSKEYYQMKEMILRRLEGVSERDGWTVKDYQRGTLKLVCPNVHMAGYAVVETIGWFLGEKEVTVRDSPGFVFTPGFVAAPQPHGMLLLLVWEDEKENKYYESVPNEIKQIRCDDSHGKNVIQPWMYTTGPGKERGWTWVNFATQRWNRTVSNNIIKDEAMPGFLSAKSTRLP